MTQVRWLLVTESAIAGWLLATCAQGRWQVGPGLYWLIFFATSALFWRLFHLSPRFSFAVTVVATTAIALMVYLVASAFFGDPMGIVIAGFAGLFSIGMHRLERMNYQPPSGRQSLHDSFAEAKRRAEELIERD